MTDPIEAFLSRLQHPLMAGIDLKLERMLRLLSLLGNPQKHVPPVIHVAGTNGKGSLIAYLQAIFEAAGLRVHRYTSPHLVHYRERIVLQGKQIDNAAIEKLLRHLAPILASQPATFFEATTALAFLAFAEKPADILLLETGMGGRLDATNVIDKPALTAITPVSFDHTDYLGSTLDKIATEKAGIIKNAVACVVGRQSAEAAAAIARKAAAMHATLLRLGEEWRVEHHHYISPARTLALSPALAGEHQYDNAATAIACIEQLPQFSITDAHITRGIASAVWPARLQPLSQHPYQRLLPAIPLFLDGGHNQQGGEVLAQWLSEQGKNAYLVCGMIQGKDMKAYLAPLAPHVRQLLAVAIPDESTSQSAQAVADAARAVGIEAAVAPGIEKALQTVAEHAKTPAVTCICGSLYLAGKVLSISSPWKGED